MGRCLGAETDSWGVGGGEQAPYPLDLLRDYIAYARRKCHPDLTEPAAAKLVQSYKDMRAAGTSRKACPTCGGRTALVCAAVATTCARTVLLTSHLQG